MTNVKSGDTIVIEHSPSPNITLLVDVVAGREIHCKHGNSRITVYEHELERSYMWVK